LPRECCRDVRRLARDRGGEIGDNGIELPPGRGRIDGRGALGIAILGSIGIAVYRSAMGDAALTGLSPASAEAARATLGGAVAVAEQLPEQLRAQLLGTARAAFASAFQLTAFISAALALVLVPVAAILLGRAGRSR
jgi:DHA2 family multidrug resistance protein-like MFS transporter